MLSRSEGYQGVLTITAPTEGGEHLSWVVDWDGKTPRPVCSCGSCMVGGLGSWNSSASRRWNVLRGALARAYEGMEFFRAVEPQERGALHFHIPIWTAKPLVMNEVQALAVAAGFGCVIHFRPAEAGDTRAAGYVSKYVTKSTDQRGGVPWDVVDKGTGEVESVADARYRTWSSSRGWGMTMKIVEQGIRDAARKRAERLLELATLATEFAVSPACRSVPPGESWPAGTVSAVP